MRPITRLHAHEALRALPPGAPPRIACLTLDLEEDFGSRTGLFRLGRREGDLRALRASLEAAGVPLSVFVVTGLLDRDPAAREAALLLADDLHAHSHTHRADGREGPREIAMAAEAFARHFGRRPEGYRAPLGLLDPADVPALAAEGYRFSASVFPSFRPGRYCHLRAPVVPLRYDNGVLELPFGVVRGLRLPVAVSYLKVLGARAGDLLLRAAPLPPVLVVNLHLHDLLRDPASFGRLPPALRLAYGVNRARGPEVLAMVLRRLRAEGYSFLTLTALAGWCAGASFQRSGRP